MHLKKVRIEKNHYKNTSVQVILKYVNSNPTYIDCRVVLDAKMNPLV